MSIPVIQSITDWRCPACGKTSQTKEVRPHQRMHTCPRMGGLTTPMVRAGTSAKIERLDREDYVGDEVVTRDDEGKVVMGLRVVRDNGQDAVVFAPAATLRGDAY